MTTNYQHCPDCEQEYVAGIAACVDCGKPLQPGPLARYAPRDAVAADDGDPAHASAVPSDHGERLLVELPGAQAHEVVQALLMEKMASRATCRGIEKIYRPDDPAPAMPFAGSLPVQIFVAAEHLESATEIVDSIGQGDLIGEQWSEAPHPDTVDIEPDYEALPLEEAATADVEPTQTPLPDPDGVREGAAGTFPIGAPQAQSVSLPMAAIVVVVVIALLYYFGRS